jgi:hypothetical protein
MNRHLSEQERLRRWRMRLAFEELEEAERLRRYRSMAHVCQVPHPTHPSIQSNH